jgi:glucose-1-phosphate cytidylyltransferase
VEGFCVRITIDDQAETLEIATGAGDQGFIDGGFFVLDPKVIDRIPGDETSWESGVLEGLANDGELRAFRHHGFWHPMDTLRDKTFLEEMWTRRKAPWKVWP